MAEKTKIQWTHHTFNGWLGCTKVAEGCQNCYAEALMDTRFGRVSWGPNGTRIRTKTWHDPAKWNRAALSADEKRKVFCSSLCDVFEDWQGQILDAQQRVLYTDGSGNYDVVRSPRAVRLATMNDLRADLVRLIDACQGLYWLLLTKRPENIRRMWPDFTKRENVWLGTSISNQKNAEEYIGKLRESSSLAQYIFLSLEPQIDFVDLAPWLLPAPSIDWVIVGGESKQPNCDPRAFNINWARDAIVQCRAAGVPCFIKQLGSNVLDGRQQLRFEDSHGGDMTEWPEDLRVRECPESFNSKIAAA